MAIALTLITGLASAAGASDGFLDDRVRVTEMEVVLERIDRGRSAPASGFVDFGLQTDASRPFTADREGTRLGQRYFIGPTARQRFQLDGSWTLGR